jgi:hypothetical protein
MPGLHDRQERKVREWLLLLLRFAVTRDANDQSAVLLLAAELDAAGSRRLDGPSFFARTSREVCRAIAAENDSRSLSVLDKHSRRIDDVRLRRAFQAAAGLVRGSALLRAGVKSEDRRIADPWRDLLPR